MEQSQRQNSGRRSNDEFLRRMLGGELSDGNTSLKGTTAGSRNHCCNGGNEKFSPSLTGNQNSGNSANNRCDLNAVSLAMVYAPTQAFQNIYDPIKALRQGTQFADLDLPFEGCGRKGACARKNTL